MSTSKIREPVQQRSIEKKKKIMEAGFLLFCEKGYHNTNTAEIAKKAGVSTGIVYNYFHNKKEIFMACIDEYAGTVSNPIYEKMEQAVNKEELIKVMGELIDEVIEQHRDIEHAHQEMQGMALVDEDVAEYFRLFEENMTLRLTEILRGHGFHDPHLHEKLHIIYNVVENLCHEVVFHHHECLDADVMKRCVLDMIAHMVHGLS